MDFTRDCAIPTVSPVLNARLRLSLYKKEQINKLNTIAHFVQSIKVSVHSFYLVLWTKGAVRDVRGEVGVVDSTECETIGPAAAEVGNVNILHKKER